jgi:hypothetical protein
MNRFIGHSQVVTTNNYNILKNTITATHKIKSAYWSLLGNESYLLNALTIELPYERLSDFLERRLSHERMNQWKSKSKLCYDRRSVGQSV